MSKRGFHCALSFCPYCYFPFSILSSPPYYPESLRFFPLFSLVPLTPAGLELPTFFAYLSLISLSSTPLHYEVQVRIHHHHHRSLLSAWRMGPLILLLQATLSPLSFHFNTSTIFTQALYWACQSGLHMQCHKKLQMQKPGCNQYWVESSTDPVDNKKSVLSITL